MSNSSSKKGDENLLQQKGRGEKETEKLPLTSSTSAGRERWTAKCRTTKEESKQKRSAHLLGGFELAARDRALPLGLFARLAHLSFQHLHLALQVRFLSGQLHGAVCCEIVRGLQLLVSDQIPSL